jgi:hypothetical protein
VARLGADLQLHGVRQARRRQPVGHAGRHSRVRRAEPGPGSRVDHRAAPGRCGCIGRVASGQKLQKETPWVILYVLLGWSGSASSPSTSRAGTRTCRPRRGRRTASSPIAPSGRAFPFRRRRRPEGTRLRRVTSRRRLRRPTSRPPRPPRPRRPDTEPRRPRSRPALRGRRAPEQHRPSSTGPGGPMLDLLIRCPAGAEADSAPAARPVGGVQTRPVH